MAEDRREEILARLLDLAEELRDRTDPVFDQVDRNKFNLSPKLRHFVLLDADETADDSDPVRTGAKTALAPRRVTLTPEVFLCAQALSEDAGSALNAMRVAWLEAVYHDAALLNLLGENGFIRYDQAISSFKIGRQLDASMLVSMSFGYILRPTAL